MQLPLAYLDATVIEEVPVDLWRKLFQEIGWPESLVGRKNSFAHKDVLDSFEHDDPADELLQAIEALHALGTESGRDAIISAMNDRRVPLEILPADAGEREYALHLFLAQRSNASLTDVFTRAQIQVQEGADHRRYNEFLGKDARVVPNLNAMRDALRDATVAYCRDNDLGDHVQVRAFDDDGDCVFHVIRSHRVQKPLAVLRGRAARATIEFRPVHSDILRYDAAIGRLRVAARAASVVDFYRRVLGDVLFQDERFFTGEPVCSLKVLQEKGRAALENHGIFGIGRVWMTECVWERGDRNLLQIRSTDCFRDIVELGLPLSEGNLIQAKLKFEVVGASTRPVTANIRVPSGIEVSQRIHEQLIDEFLNAVGIRNSQPPLSEIDLWSLYPWRHPAPVWRVLFGRETDALVQRGVLVPIQLEAIPAPERVDAGRVLGAHPISGGEFFGVSRVAEIPSRSLSSTDLDGLELAPEQLRLYLRARFGIAGASVAWDGRELLDLGELVVGGERIRLTYALRPLPAGTGPRIREKAGAARALLLIPSSRDDTSELAKVRLAEPLPSQGLVIRESIAACGLASAVAAVYSAPDNARLVVDTIRGQVWVDGVEIRAIHTGTHPFQLVEALARSSPSPVSTEDLTTQLSEARKDGDTTARQAKADARKSIINAMAEAGREFDEDPFPSGPTGCYRCAFVSYVA